MRLGGRAHLTRCQETNISLKRLLNNETSHALLLNLLIPKVKLYLLRAGSPTSRVRNHAPLRSRSYLLLLLLVVVAVLVLLLLQWSCHSVIVVLTLVQTNQ